MEPKEHRAGKRKQLTSIVIARGENVRYFTLRLWPAALIGSSLVILAISFLLAATYFVFRDDLMKIALAEQATMKAAYEQRIDELRVDLDRAWSRRLLDERRTKRKLADLIERHNRLVQQHTFLDAALKHADQNPMPIPTPRPEVRVKADSGGLHGTIPTSITAYAAVSSPETWSLRGGNRHAGGGEIALSEVGRSLHRIETEQIERLRVLEEKAEEVVEDIASALGSIRAPMGAKVSEQNVGGPLLSLAGAEQFDIRMAILSGRLDRLEQLKQIARRTPIRNPIPRAAVTSPFGPRRDPIIGELAHHSGVDFRARHGTPVRTGGPGTVVEVGWHGGYGRMVEINHGAAITTRYGHLSEISVSSGDRIEAGTIIGRVGSSGRSTGPHLHYEVRRNGSAVDPLNFISAGRRINDYL